MSCSFDIDGVINSEDYAVYRDEAKKFDLDEDIDERAVVFLNYIVNKTDAKIVLSSTWRSDMEDIYKRLVQYGFKYEFFDRTPYHPDRHRGTEIKMWIDKYEETHEPLESYVIIDDDDDMLEEQMEHFVRCNYVHGLTSHECFKAIDILKKTEEE